MAIAAAESLAKYAEKRGINPDNIIPNMDEADVFPIEAADVAVQAIKDGVARIEMTWDEAYQKAKADIEYSRGLSKHLSEAGYIDEPDYSMLEKALEFAVAKVREG
jgi:malate dehydrogenase (oxaloacetate-decarboxylating)